jgi:RNA polymerase sigma-70 factor, ECF subfamily
MPDAAAKYWKIAVRDGWENGADAELLSGETDEDLLARIGRSDSAAVREMIARKLPRLLALAARILGDRMEAEDVAQEAFLRIWRQAPRWEPGRARFDTWLYAVAFNLCRDRLRRRREVYTTEQPETADPSSAPDRGLDHRDTARTVESALAMLPDRQREAIVLQYYEELPNVEAAAVMGISVEALESLLARARRNLRACLENADACH